MDPHTPESPPTMTDEPKPNAAHDAPMPPPLPTAAEIDDPFETQPRPPLIVVPLDDDDIPTMPVVAVRRTSLPPDDLPEAKPIPETLPSRKPTVVGNAPDKPKTLRPAIDLEPPRPKVWLSLFIIFLMAVAAALALTVLFYSIYVGFQTLKPNTNRKKALVAPMQRPAPAITIA